MMRFRHDGNAEAESAPAPRIYARRGVSGHAAFTLAPAIVVIDGFYSRNSDYNRIAGPPAGAIFYISPVAGSSPGLPVAGRLRHHAAHSLHRQHDVDTVPGLLPTGRSSGAADVMYRLMPTAPLPRRLWRVCLRPLSFALPAVIYGASLLASSCASSSGRRRWLILLLAINMADAAFHGRLHGRRRKTTTALFYAPGFSQAASFGRRGAITFGDIRFKRHVVIGQFTAGITTAAG